MQQKQSQVILSNRAQFLQELLETKYNNLKNKLKNEISPWSFYKEQIDSKPIYPASTIRKNYSLRTSHPKIQEQPNKTQIEDNPETKAKLQKLNQKIISLMNERLLVKVLGKYLQMSEKSHSKANNIEKEQKSNKYSLPSFDISAKENPILIKKNTVPIKHTQKEFYDGNILAKKQAKTIEHGAFQVKKTFRNVKKKRRRQYPSLINSENPFNEQILGHYTPLAKQTPKKSKLKNIRGESFSKDS